MTLHQLRIFESVARHLNMTKASEELRLSQPAVSHQLKLLEEEFGTTFHARINQGVELTKDGRTFLEAIRPILAQVEDIESSFASKLRERRSGLLAIGGSYSLSATVLPEVLTVFKQTHPRVECVLETADSGTMERRIVNAEVDIALITNSSHSSHLTYEPFNELEMVAFAPAASPLTMKKMTLREFTQVPLVVRRRGSTVSELLLRQGYKLNIVAQCEASEAVKAAVQRGMGVGLLYRGVIERELIGGDLKIIDVPDMKKMKIKSFIAYPIHRPLSNNAKDFLNVLRQWRAKDEAAGPKHAT